MYIWSKNVIYICKLPLEEHYIFYSEWTLFERQIYMEEFISEGPTDPSSCMVSTTWYQFHVQQLQP